MRKAVKQAVKKTPDQTVRISTQRTLQRQRTPAHLPVRRDPHRRQQPPRNLQQLPERRMGLRLGELALIPVLL
jgi:hypothetical protein